MNEFAYLLGGLIGAMLDPLLWVIAGVAVFAFPKAWWFWRLLGSAIASLLIGAGISAWRFSFFGPTSPMTFFFATLATMAWFGIFIGFRSLRARRRAAAEK